MPGETLRQWDRDSATHEAQAQSPKFADVLPCCRLPALVVVEALMRALA